jgi:hypothetical protein
MVDMLRAISALFVPAAVVFLLLCLSVLSLAAASTVVSVSSNDGRATRDHILATLLR